MKCPKCKQEIRGAERLDEDLVGNRCERCGGHWISAYQYWRWRELQPRPPAYSPAVAESGATASSDSKSALLCAECGRILHKYRIAADIPSRVDHCGHCGGTWFDAGEWAALRDMGLLGNVHSIFTAVWQREIRAEDSRVAQARIYEKRFGPDGYAELRRIRDWLNEQPHKSAMLRFLSDSQGATEKPSTRPGENEEAYAHES